VVMYCASALETYAARAPAAQKAALDGSGHRRAKGSGAQQA
jgi:hypothetical protein